MIDLSVDLGRIQLKNPLICASSEFSMSAAGIRAALDYGAGAVIAKSVNESPDAARQLDIAEYVLLDEQWRALPWDGANPDASLFCRSGLAQTPLEEWLRMVAEADDYARTKNAYVAGSITVAQPGPAAEIAAAMEAAGLRWIELNLGAPHGREAARGAVRQITDAEMVRDYVEQVRRVIKIPLAVKLTGQSGDFIGIAAAAAAAGADMLVMIGRFLGFMPDIETYQPILGSAGAIGGHWALPVSLYWISKCWRELQDRIPLIGTNGARNADDVVRMTLSGARAVEFASAVLTEGAKLFPRILRDLEAYCERKPVARMADLLGLAADAAMPYSTIKATPNRQFPWQRRIQAKH